MWRYIINKNRWILNIFENFVNMINRDDVIYVLICLIKIYANKFQNVFYQILHFENVFNVKSTFILLSHDEYNYVIYLILNKSLFYEFLYNMFQHKIRNIKKIYSQQFDIESNSSFNCRCKYINFFRFYKKRKITIWCKLQNF